MRECWKDYPEAVIYELVIVPNFIKNNNIEFYYCLNDAPNFQVASINKSHIQKHYGNDCELKKFIIQTKYLNDFINDVIEKEEQIELLALNIEGIDPDVILNLNFNNIKLKYLSFEFIHLGNNEQSVITYLYNNNFSFLGKCFDYNGFDYLFKYKMLKMIFIKNISALQN